MKSIDEVRNQNLRFLVTTRGGVTNLAEQIGKSPSQISQWLNRSLNSETGKPRAMGTVSARHIEGHLGLEFGWMDRLHDEAGIVLAGPPGHGQVPVLSWARAGDYLNIVDNHQPDTALEYIRVGCPIGRYTFAARVNGESMLNPNGSPSFPEGILVVIEPELDARVGDFVAVKSDSKDEAVFKQLMQDDGVRYLRSLNPAYQTRPFPADGRLVGVVREALWKFR